MSTSVKQLLTGKLFHVKPEATTSETIDIMREERISCILVIDGGYAAGILTERDVMRLIHQKSDLTLPVETAMSSPVYAVSSDTSIFEAYETLKNRDIRHLSVTEHGKVIGVLTHSDLMRAVGMMDLLRKKKAGEIMLSSVSRVAPGDSLSDVITIMIERMVSSVIVTRDRKPLGMITERDIPVIAKKYVNTAVVSAEEVMTSPVCTVDITASAHDASEALRRNRIRQLVVVDHNGYLAGIITQANLLSAFEQQYIEHMRNQLNIATQRLSKSVLLTNIMNSEIDAAIVALDKNMVVALSNPAAAHIFQEEDLTGHRLQDILKQAHFTVIKQDDVVSVVAKNGSFKSVIERGSGEQSIEVNFSSIMEDGELLGYLLIANDITERLERERERTSQMQQLRELSRALDHAGEGVIITDINGVIQYANPTLCRLTEYDLDELIGQTPTLFKSGKQNNAFYKVLWDTVLSGSAWQGTLIDRRKNGDLYPALTSIAPVFDEHGKIASFVGIQKDMTEYVMLEDQLHQSQKMESLGTLVGGIAHDFNNMLAGITGNLFLARSLIRGNVTAVERLDAVEQLSFRAASMIQQLLTFARKDRVKMKLFGLSSFLQEILQLNTLVIPENIDFSHEIIAEDLIIMGDETQLQQVIMNLLNNAHDAVDGVKDPRVRLRLQEFLADEAFRQQYPDMDAEAFACLLIDDNGCGIADEEIDKVFDPFYTTKEVGKGTGLGLAIRAIALKS